jgi:hypothetical protein
VKFSLHLWPLVFLGEGGGAIYPPAALDYVVPSRADDVSHSPGSVAVTLSEIKSAPRWLTQTAVCA